MESKFQTSFIPRSPVTDTGKIKNKTPISILSVVATLIIVLSIAAAVLLSVYEIILTKQLESKKQAVTQSFEETKNSLSIDNLSTLTSKLRAGQMILDQHISLTPIFALLEENTLKRLKYNSLSINALTDSKVVITVSGEAKDYGVVAKQSDAFADFAKNMLTGPIFSNISETENGTVKFDFMSLVSPELISYKP